MLLDARKLRRAITSRLPTPLVTPARRFARLVDQACGLPLSPWRRGTVAMFHIGRCGSTVLGDLLGQHPQILWDQEIYFQRWAESGLKFKGFDNQRFLRRRMWAAGRRYYGFEIKFLDNQHLAIIRSDLTRFIGDCLNCGVSHFIILRRKNHLRTLISWVVARQRGQHHIDRSKHAERTSVHLDVNKFCFGALPTARPLLDWFEYIGRRYGDLAKLLDGRTVLSLSYERDILQGPQAAFQRCCEFLDLQPYAGRINYARTNPFPIADILENYQEVEQVLSGTRYEWMLFD